MSKGMLRNHNKLSQDNDFYTYALNMTPTNVLTDRSTKLNEHKLSLSLKLEDTDYIILGVTWLGKDEYVYFTKNKIDNSNNIWLVNNDIKTLKYSNIELNFQFNKLISSTYRIDFKGDRLIYFVDGFNKDRVINIDKINLSSDIESLNLIPYYGVSNLIKINTIEGGKLLMGNYFVAVTFLDENNVETNIRSLSNTLSIGDGIYFENRNSYSSQNDFFVDNNTSFLEVRGLNKDSQSTKGIQVEIDDINDKYLYMNIYLIRMTEETTEVKVLENISITNSFTITGSENFINLGNSLSRIITSNILYNRSEVITQKDNRLIRANTKIDSINQKFQELANTITVNWFTPTSNVSMIATTTDSAGVFMPADDTNKGINDFDSTILLYSSSPDYLSNNTQVLNKTFSRDEVYALGVYFELDNGSLTDVYHIPGRLPNPGLTGGNETIGMPMYAGNSHDSDFDTKLFNYGKPLTPTPRWKIANTSVLTNLNFGLLGYYRTEEVYPDGYGFPTNGEQNSEGKSYIRHHRIPSDILVPIVNLEADRFPGNSTTNTKGYSNTQASRRYIGLTFNFTIPTEFQNVIKKVYYTYSPKSNTNKFVLGKGITYMLNGSRQSDQLNRYATETNITNGYEFYCPESMFKFKESNISAKRIKPTCIIQGVARYVCKPPDKRWYRNGQSTTPRWPTYINSEGANFSGTKGEPTVDSYNYSQLVRFDSVFYNKRLNLNVSDLITNRLRSIKFVDENSTTTLDSKSINLTGNKKAVYFSLDAINTPYLDLGVQLYTSQLGTTDSLSNLMTNYPLKDSTSSSGVNPLPIDETYTDAVAFSTLLSDNFNIDYDLINLQYEVSNMVIDSINTILEGDSYIDIMYGKRGFSDVLTNQLTGNKSSSEYIITIFTGGTAQPNRDYLDTIAYNDFFAFYTESQLNMRMRYSTAERDYFPNNTLNIVDLANMFEKQVDKDEFYDLDDGYNKVNVIKYNGNTIKLSDEYISQRRLETRMVYSELQNYESKIDNYRSVLASNYKDLITTRGGIYQMFTKQERLYAITRDSLFLINTSNQTLKTDSSNNITIGTGAFFGIEPNEIISIDGGIGGTSSKLSLNENPYGYLYVDRFKNKVMLFNEGLDDINTFGLQEDFKLELDSILDSNDLDNPQLGYGISTGFDPVLHRLLVTKKDFKPVQTFIDNYKGNYDSTVTYLPEDYYSREGLIYSGNGNLINIETSDLFENKSKTLSYDPILKNWISYHDYFPYRYIKHSNYVRPVLEDINYYSKDFANKSEIELIFNQDPLYTKVFDSIGIDMRSEDVNGNSTNDSFTSLVAYNEFQSTGNINLNNTNLTRNETYWHFNKLLDNSIEIYPKELFKYDWNSIKNNYFTDKVINNSIIDFNKPYNKKARLRDKYMLVRLTRNNLDNKKIICNFVNSNVRVSQR